MSKAKVVSFGSSAGGFASIMSAVNGFSDLALAVNPQTDIRKYYRRHSDPYMAACWPGFVEDDERHVSLVKAIQGARSAKPFIYAQNTKDPFHVDNHMKPFMEAVSMAGAKASFVDYMGPAGHTPPIFPGLLMS